MEQRPVNIQEHINPCSAGVKLHPSKVKQCLGLKIMI